MAMTDVAKLFGFGSYFKADVRHPNDIDLLILHHDTDTPSVDIAIAIKSLLIGQIPVAHIVMLSEPEEHDLSFLKRSDATLLGSLQKDCLSEQIHTIGLQILALRAETATDLNNKKLAQSRCEARKAVGRIPDWPETQI